MAFEWDEEKRALNFRKHRIRFEIAIQAFEDDLAIPFSDPEHSTVDEPRFALLGMCESGLVFVSFTMRGENYRIITARKASKRMHKIYAEND